MRLKINPLVIPDLKRIREYIEEDNEEAAKKTINDIYESFELIAKFPLMGKELAKRVSFKTDYRYLIHKDYVVLYRAGIDFVEIYRVIDHDQDFIALLFK